eukprot:6724801-Prorocentrum_lima.AAC.1
MPGRAAGALSACQLRSQASTANGLHAGCAPGVAVVWKLPMYHPTAGRGRISPGGGRAARS